MVVTHQTPPAGPPTSNPAVGFDLTRATSGSFAELVSAFTEWVRSNPPSQPFPHQDGWIEFTPEMALNFLQYTVLGGGNRKTSLNTVLYYADQMRAQDWQRTGQPMIVDQSGQGQDGQHRAWASLLTGVTFPTYIVASVPPFENLFAYMDNSKPRSIADALQTAGLNGSSKLIGSVIALARHYDAGVMTVKSKGKVPKVNAMAAMRYLNAHPELRDAVALARGEYQEQADLFLKEDVAAFVIWKIKEIAGEESLDDFLSQLVSADVTAGNAEGNPILALAKKLKGFAEHDQRNPGDKTPAVGILAHVIKTFNAWRTHTAMRTVSVRIDERFPLFTDTSVEAEAA
jgi:hypothetical protein